MFNKVILAGNLTRDIEMKYTPSNLSIATTAIATNRKFKTQTGEQKEEVMFLDITFFGRTAEVANQYLKKGSKVLVEGRLKFDQWTDNSGQKKSKHSLNVDTMQMINSNGDQPDTTRTKPIQQEQAQQAEHTPPLSIEEDEIPF